MGNTDVNSPGEVNQSLRRSTALLLQQLTSKGVSYANYPENSRTAQTRSIYAKKKAREQAEKQKKEQQQEQVVDGQGGHAKSDRLLIASEVQGGFVRSSFYTVSSEYWCMRQLQPAVASVPPQNGM